jgi:hypothetical protein
MLRNALTMALADAGARRAGREPGLGSDTPGFYLDFEIPPGSGNAAESLESRTKQIELIAVRRETEISPTFATVFVPDNAADHFLQKIEAYRTEETPNGQPKFQDLIARIQGVVIATVRSLYKGDPALFPLAGECVWWEVWTRNGYLDVFDTVARHLLIRVQPHRLVFPDRAVRLVYADDLGLARLFLNSDAIAEVRRAQDTPGLFMEWNNVEQAACAADLTDRVVTPDHYDVAVCLLDTGVTRAHPLLTNSLAVEDVHAYDPTWQSGDQQGHGTKMAGTALYGDLMPLLVGTGPVVVTHCLESVKILPDQGDNEPRLYGAITGESIARAEIGAPNRRRAVCMAVTSDMGTNRGQPSSWSAAIDQLCFDQTANRLILISAGNIRDGITRAAYPDRNETESIENPAQAWNAVTVGAYTEKTTLVDQSFAGWEAVAPAGGLCPTSRTSVMWSPSWPVKPDVVLEGGNWASLDDQCDCPDDLGLLTTSRDPTIRHFDIFRDTSAATAMAGNLAGKIMAVSPQRWPETIRAMIVHSAEWTPMMQAQFAAATSKQQKLALLRKYGYGVPNYERAVLSAANDLTLIVEDELQPFWKDGSVIKTRHMNLHQFPWPKDELEQLGETEVELRLTLSYYVEPNPGERGWLRRHRYQSHALRFAVNRALESVGNFRTRINAAAVAEEEGQPANDAGSDDWYLGPKIRNAGSLHSDYWRGTAADLAQRSAVGVYPVGGWWKENKAHHRYNRHVRYSLLVSIRAVNGEIDIYTPVAVKIRPAIEITT